MTRTPVSESLASQLATPTLVLDVMGRMAFVHPNQARDYIRDDHDGPVMFTTYETASDAYYAAIAAVSAVLKIGAE